ncbi:hypothetical protein BDP27DRAFT_1315473 [Rhodocollybia butyracea]|uniref:Uncharacterized protein n=1 Tax=Rhodocollybia butyracea TaxID=206335 RepID=A0A9P5Q647_9AGAR|nr:hypothetical protein BDP27DRAFT_1315473 [Rhodocollybia butyracea]
MLFHEEVVDPSSSSKEFELYYILIFPPWMCSNLTGFSLIYGLMILGQFQVLSSQIRGGNDPEGTCGIAVLRYCVSETLVPTNIPCELMFSTHRPNISFRLLLSVLFVIVVAPTRRRSYVGQCYSK